jgi:hypothetical protein
LKQERHEKMKELTKQVGERNLVVNKKKQGNEERQKEKL